MAQLPHDEAQKLIYRGCARLAKAMQVKHIAKDAAQKWEDEALREARVILAAAVNGPLTHLVLPPLPLALLEVHKSHHRDKHRPMKPSDIHCPFTQASTSPWAVWMADEDDAEIPSQIDLGDPCTFWWEDLEERTTGKATPVLVPLNDEDVNASPSASSREPTPPPVQLRDCLDGDYWRKRRESDADEHGTAGETLSGKLTRRLRSATKRSRPDLDESESEQSSTTSEPGPSNRSSKRYRADSSSSDEDEGRYVYTPKCDGCKDQGWSCHVARWGQSACTGCKMRKRRCSAFQSDSRIVSRSPSPVNRKRKSTRESIRDRLRRRGTESIRAPFSLGYELVSKASVRPAEQPMIAVPSRNWFFGEHTNVKRVTVSRHPSSSSRSQGMTLPAALMTRTSGAAAQPAPAPAITPIPSPPTAATTRKRVLVDKSVATESEPLERSGCQEIEFMKKLVSLILDAIQTHQGGPSIPRTVPASASGPATGSEPDRPRRSK